MSITVTYVSQATVVETLGGGYVSSADATVTTNGLNTTAELTASTTPPATKYSAGQKALSSGSGTIDLTSLPDSDGVAARVDFTGLKVQLAKLRNPSTNANNITVTEGASNGYELHGNAFTMLLRPGEEVTWKGADGAPDVASGARTIDLSGTGSQVLEFEFVAG